MKKVILYFVVLSFLFTSKLWAQEAVDNVWRAANSKIYGTKFGGMLGRGLLNISTCFVDLVVHVVEGTKQGPPFVGSLTGLGSGLGCTALRVTSGALDVLTFWVPDFNGFPVARSYSNCTEFSEEEMEMKPQEFAPAAPAPAPTPEEYAKPAEPAKLAPEDYAKPAAPAKRSTYDYIKK